MKEEEYLLIESFMLSNMQDSAHDKEHIYRVLYNALEIAPSEAGVDYDILIAACLLHDIGRAEQFENPDLCHAEVGAQKAYRFLFENGFGDEYSKRVRQCIQTHRYRKNNPPQSIEAKILFDADKLDQAGAIGIARTLLYKGKVSDPLYLLLPDGSVSSGESDENASFFQEYRLRLEKLYSNFYTQKAAELANERKSAAAEFYNRLYTDVSSAYQNGKKSLSKLLKE